MYNKFTCFVIGEDSLLIKCSETLLEKGHQVFGIVSSNTAIHKWAAENRLNVYSPDKELASTLKAQVYDYLFSITNLSILQEEVISSPSKFAINFHDGPLPKYAGKIGRAHV